MKAIECPRYGPPEVLRLTQVAKPTPRANEVLIRVVATTVHVGDVRIRTFDVPRGQRLIARSVLGVRRPRQPILGMELAGVVESVKAASDIYAPISGTVIAVNESLEDSPETVNQDPYGDGWFFRIEPDDVAELEELLDADGYSEVCEADEH